MREPQIAQTLVRAVVNAVPANVPVTVKHRAGWNQDNRNAPEFACAMVEAGAQMITVHGRTRTQGFAGKSDPDIIRLVREAVPSHIPVVGNGDIVDVEGYLRLRGLYGCNQLRLRAWEAPDLAAARALVEGYFADLIERRRRLGVAPEDRGEP